MSVDIGPRIGIDGEAEFRKQISQITQQIKTFGAELSAVTSEFAENETGMEALTAKNEVLNKTIDAQSKKLEELKKGLEAASKEFGENDTKTLKWAQAVNQATADLNRMQNQVEKNNASMAQMAGEAGFADLKKEIDQLTQEARTLDTEMEAVTSEFKDNGKSAQELAAKNKVLSKAAETQEKKLEALKKGLAAATQEYGENDARTQKWRQETNQATAQLNRMKKQLQESGEEMEEAGKQASEFGDILKGSLAADLITSALSTIADSIRDVGQALMEYSQEQEAAFKKTTAYFGETGEAAAQTERVITEVFTGGVGDSISEVGDAVRVVKENLDGLSETDMANLTNQAMTLDSLYGIDMNETLRGVNSLMEQFGMDAQTAMDYVVAGTQNGLDKTNELGDNLAEYAGKFSQAGYSAQEYFQLLDNGLEGGAYNLDKVNDAINEVTTRLADGTLGDSIKSYSKETQKLFKEWKKGGASQKQVIDSIVSDIRSTENQQKALNLAVTAFGTMAEDGNLKFITSLSSVGDTYGKVEGKAQELFAATTTSEQKMVSGMRTIQEQMEPIGESMNGIMGEIIGGLVMLTQDLDLEGFAGILTDTFGAVQDIFQGIADGSLTADEGFRMILEGAAQMLASLIKEIGDHLPEMLVSGIEMFASLRKGLWEAAPDILETVGEAMVDMIGNILEHVPDMIQAGVDLILSMVDGVASSGPELLTTGAQLIIDLLAEIASHLPEILESGFKLIGELIAGIIKAIPDVIAAIPGVIAGIRDTILEYDWMALGQDILAGLANGILGYAGTVIDAAKEASGKIADAFKDFFDINSPSRLMKDEVGRQITAGIAEGILADKKYAKKSAEEVASAIVSAAEKKLENTQVYNQLSLADEAAFWDEMRQQVKEGTQARIDADKKYFAAKKSLDDSIVSQEKQYKDSVSKVYQELSENIRDAWQSYRDEVDSLTDSIKSQMNLFERFEASTELSTGDLLDNLQSQVEGLTEWRESLDILKERGLSDELVKELEEMGTSAAGEVKQLTKMTDQELEQYASLWGEKNTLAREAAEEQLEPLKESTRKQIEQMRREAREELEAYQEEYMEAMGQIGVQLSKPLEEVKNALVTSFADLVGTLADTVNTQSGSEANKEKYGQVAEQIIESASGLPDEFEKIGINTMDGIIEGINQKSSDLYATIQAVIRETIAAAQQTAQIHSPSRVMRDLIGKNMIAGLAEGLDQYGTMAMEAASRVSGDVMDMFEGRIPTTANGNAAAYDRLAAAMSGIQVVLDDGTLVGKLGPRIDTTLGGYGKLKRRYHT